MGLIFDSRIFAVTLLRETLAIWSETMMPYFTYKAREHWGEEWETECASFLSKNMQEQLKSRCVWDTFRIISVISKKPAIFWIDYNKLSDSVKEIYRNRLHHLKFLRDRMAHFPAPSIAECLAGAMAAKDLLASHSIQAPESLLSCIHLLRAVLPSGDPSPLEVDRPNRHLCWAVADTAFEVFVAEIGGKARSFWYDKKYVPADLNEISGLVRHLQLQSGRNQQLSKWHAYKNWNFDIVKDRLDTIKACRDILNHEALELNAEKVCDLVMSISKVFDELATPNACLEPLLEMLRNHCIDCAERISIPVLVSRKVDAAAVRMQIGFSTRQLVGRDHLIAALTDDILERARRGAHSRTALTGQSGVGKTVLAREICNKLQQTLPLQVLLLGTSCGTLQMELARLGRAFTPNLADESNEGQAVEAARRFLANTTGYILLVDDAIDLDELWPLLPTDEAGRQAGHVLFTTQQRSGWAGAELLTAVHEVRTLTTDEALEMLESSGRDDARVRRVVTQDSEIDLRGFVEHELGNLPLAVSMAKNALHALDVSAAREVMARLRQNVVSELGVYQEGRYLRTLEGLVRELIEVRLWRRCCEESVLCATATRLLSMLCVLDADEAPDELIAAASNSAEMLEKSIAALVDVGLVDSDRINRVSSMHSLYQRCIFNYFQAGLDVSLLSWGYVWRALEGEFISQSSDAKAHSRKLLRLYGSARCAGYCTGDKEASNKQGRCFLPLAENSRARLHTALGLVVANLIHDWTLAKQYLASSLEINQARRSSNHPDVANSLEHLALLHQGMGNYEQALDLQERALMIRETTLGLDHLDVATSLNNIATLHQAMGRYIQALPLHERALAICEAKYGSYHSDLATSLNNLASLHQAMGEYMKALPLYQRALVIVEATVGPDHPGMAACLSNLASLHQAMGEHEQALPLHKRSLTVLEAILGPDHPDVATGLSRLASLQQLTGEHEQALQLLERALVIQEATLGPDHPDTAKILNDIALLQSDMGKHKQAQLLLQRVLVIWEATRGPNHPDVAKGLNNLASLHKSMGELERALKLFERALAINEATLGPDHPGVAVSLNNLASHHQAMGKNKQALPLLERALAIMEATLGPHHPNVATSFTNLALLHQAMGEHKKALPLLELALAIREAVLGPDHPDVAASQNNLASLHHAMGEHKMALPRYERALAIMEATLGLDHSAVAASINNLASLHQAMGEYTMALPLHKRALSILEATLGPDHPDVASSLSNVATLHQTMGDNGQALELYDRALAIRVATYGPDHSAVATSLNNIASLHQEVGEYRQALPLHKRALAIWEATLGPDHPDVATSLHNLAVLYQAMGEHELALPLHHRVLTIWEAAFGSDHPDVATSLYNLALLHRAMGEPEQALPLFERVLFMWEARHGPDHPDVATLLNQIATLHQAMGRYKQALPLHERALASCEAILGPDHPDVATCLSNLASLHQNMGEYMMALPLYKRALAILEVTLGHDHPDVAECLSNLASLHQAMGEHEQALPLLIRAQTLLK